MDATTSFCYCLLAPFTGLTDNDESALAGEYTNMPLRAYSEINLHLTWRVKDNNSVIHDEIEQQLHRFLKGKAAQTPGVSIQGIGGRTITSIWWSASRQPCN